MKKSASILFSLLAISTIGLAACGGDSTEQSQVPPVDTQQTPVVQQEVKPDYSAPQTQTSPSTSSQPASSSQASTQSKTNPVKKTSTDIREGAKEVQRTAKDVQETKKEVEKAAEDVKDIFGKGN